jgi:hypothetical protein
MTEALFNRRAPQPPARSQLHRSRLLVSMGLAVVAVAGMLTPYPSVAGPERTVSSSGALAANCSPAPVALREQCHLDLNDRMKMDLGTWGNGVHPNGPNYFCVKHRKQLEEERKPTCARSRTLNLGIRPPASFVG